MKLTKRKGFNFFRSYYDVYNELSDKDKVAFIDALLDKQFLGKNPENLKGMANFAYISQTNSIDSQVKGYEDKTKSKLEHTPTDGATAPPTDGGASTPTVQVQVQGKEKVQDVYRKFKHLSLTKIQFEKLKETYTKEQIDNVLDAIENYAKNKNYTSLNLTAIKWLQKEHPSNTAKCPYNENQIRLAKSQMQSGGGLPEWFDPKYKEFVEI